MVMYFQLLRGLYEDRNGVRYEASAIKNEKGETVSTNQPVIKTDVDLVECFGTHKFKRLTEEQMNLILLPEARVSGTEVMDAPVPDASGKFAGRDVTKDFPDAESANLHVIFEGKNNYRVYDGADGKELTPCSLKRKEVASFIKGYLEN